MRQAQVARLPLAGTVCLQVRPALSSDRFVNGRGWVKLDLNSQYRSPIYGDGGIDLQSVSGLPGPRPQPEE